DLPAIHGKVSPAQVVFVLKVQTRCAHAGPPARSAPEGRRRDVARMGEAVKQLAELKIQALQKGKLEGLTFKLQRILVE
ncbi:unnamed protein product, partial [Prorocentrum cordatum]